MKRTFACFLVLVFCFTLVFCTPANAAGFTPDFELYSASVYMVNADSGVVMYEKDAHTERSVASLTKLMTALLLIENTPNLAGTTFYAEPTLYDELYGLNASTADIRPYEEVDGLSLLYAMMLPSANEAANIAAYQLSGGVRENFYAMMNARALQLGCKNTNFTSANGLADMEDGNYSSAYDIMLITQECMKHEIFRTVVSSNSYGMPFTNIHTTAEYATAPDVAYTIYSTNLMQRITTAGIHRSYIQGIKTGSTIAAGRCFVSSAVKDGETYYCVVLGSDYDATDEEGYALSFTDTANLYDWAFASFSLAPALDTGSPIAEVKVKYSSDTDAVMVYPESDAKTILPVDTGGEDYVNPVTMEFHMPSSIDAPVKRGDAVGTVDVYVDGIKISTVNLLAAQDVNRNNVLFVLEKIGEFFGSTYFKVVVVLTLVCVVGYVILYVWVMRTERKRRAQKKRRSRQSTNRKEDNENEKH